MALSPQFWVCATPWRQHQITATPLYRALQNGSLVSELCIKSQTHMNDMVETIFSLQISSVFSSEHKQWSLVLQLSSCLIIFVMPLLQSKQSVPFSISAALHCALSNLFMFYLTSSVKRSKKKKRQRKVFCLSHVIKKCRTLRQRMTFQCNFIFCFLRFFCLKPSLFCYVWLTLSWLCLNNCSTSKTAEGAK